MSNQAPRQASSRGVINMKTTQEMVTVLRGGKTYEIIDRSSTGEIMSAFLAAKAKGNPLLFHPILEGGLEVSINLNSFVPNDRGFYAFDGTIANGSRQAYVHGMLSDIRSGKLTVVP